MPQFTLKDRKENYKSHGLEDFFKNHPGLLGVKGCVSIKRDPEPQINGTSRRRQSRVRVMEEEMGVITFIERIEMK